MSCFFSPLFFSPRLPEKTRSRPRQCATYSPRLGYALWSISRANRPERAFFPRRPRFSVVEVTPPCTDAVTFSSFHRHSLPLKPPAAAGGTAPFPFKPLSFPCTKREFHPFNLIFWAILYSLLSVHLCLVHPSEAPPPPACCPPLPNPRCVNLPRKTPLIRLKLFRMVPTHHPVDSLICQRGEILRSFPSSGS